MLSSPSPARILILLFSIVLLAQSTVQAQASQRTYTGARVFLNYDNTSVAVAAIKQTDTVINGRISYTAAVTINVTELAGKLLMQLRQVAEKGLPTQISITTTDFNYKAEDVTSYQDAAISGINFSTLDGASKDVLTATISFAARNIKISPAGGKPELPAIDKPKFCLASNFRFTLANLPSSRVVSVERLSLTPGATLRVTLSPADEAAWKEALYSGKGNKLEGSIELLAPDMRRVIFKIELKEVDIVSFTKETVTTSEQISRPKLGLRVKQLVLVAE